jgi:DNA topoisomerase-1
MVVASIKLVASRLGNTPAVCRASYVHPAIIESYVAGELVAHPISGDEDAHGLRMDELQLQAFLAGLPHA